MPEQKISISFRIDDVVIKHNNRDIQPKNVDLSRTKNNIIYAQTNLREFYHQLFDEALAEYNAKQNRSDRKIADYYEHIRKADKGKLFYEVVVQFGDLQNCGVGSENWETAKTMLDEYMREFEKRNPEQVYSFKNDVHIDNMLNMIWVADRLSITSLDSAYAKARMFQKDIEWIREGGTEPGQLVSNLEEINNFISNYEKYVIGNYIDNRINEQKTTETTQTAPHIPKHRR